MGRAQSPAAGVKQSLGATVLLGHDRNWGHPPLLAGQADQVQSRSRKQLFFLSHPSAWVQPASVAALFLSGSSPLPALLSGSSEGMRVWEACFSPPSQASGPRLQGRVVSAAWGGG